MLALLFIFSTAASVIFLKYDYSKLPYEWFSESLLAGESEATMNGSKAT